MSWFYLALLAPLLWAVVVLIDDNLLRHVYKGPYLAAIVSGLFGVAPLISLFWLDLAPTATTTMFWATMAGFVTVIYYFFYFRALERESPSTVIALMSLTPRSLPLFAHYVVGEDLSTTQFIGFFVVLGASFMLALTDVKKFKFSNALVSVVAASVLYAIASLGSKYSYEQTNFYTGYMFFCLGMGAGGLFFIYVMLYRRQKEILKGIIKRNNLKIILFLVFSELLNIGAEFAQNLAISRGPVSLIKAVENIQPVYMLLIAIVLYPFFPKYFRDVEHGHHIAYKLAMMLLIAGGVYITVR